MRVWGVLAPDKVKELARVGALVKGKVISVDGERVLLDFGEFVGEGKWEATQPLPQEGDVVLVRIMDDTYPIPLKFIKVLKKAKKEVLAKKLPPMPLPEEMEDEEKKAVALLLKIANKASRLFEEAHHHTSRTQMSTDSPTFFVSIPLVFQEKTCNLYMLCEERKSKDKERVHVLRVLLEDTPLGDVRVDFSYAEGSGRLAVTVFVSEKKGYEIFEKGKEELEEAFKRHGFKSVFFVVRRHPEAVSRIALVRGEGLLERRI